MINAFMLSFGVSHGYFVLSLDVPAGSTAGLITFAMWLAVANLCNCVIGALGAMYIVCPVQQTSSPSKQEPVVVVQGTAVDEKALD